MSKEERLEIRDELEVLTQEKKQLEDKIEGVNKSADYDWYLYKKTGNKKHFFSAIKKYEERKNLEGALCDLEKEIEFAKHKWNKLKKVA